MLVLWFCAIAWVFSGVLWQDYRWFLPADNALLAQEVPRLSPHDLPTLYHLHHPDCACGRYSTPHVQSLMREQPALTHVLVTPDKQSNFPTLAPLLRDFSAPAVILVDRQGHIRYAGPYTSGQLCGQGDDLLSAPLQALAARPEFGAAVAAQVLNVGHFGCYCRFNAQRKPRDALVRAVG